jgi:competence protein ComEA
MAPDPMAPSPDNTKSKARSPWLRRSDQTFAMFAIAIFVVLAGGQWVYKVQHRGDLIEIDQAPPLKAAFTVDINSAAWPEIVQLPGIGETTARRIVDVRETDGRFASLADLEQRVHGIGPRMIAEIKPFIAPIPAVESDTQQASVTTNPSR